MRKQELLYSMICALMGKSENIFSWEHLGMVPNPNLSDQGRVQGESDTYVNQVETQV